MSIIDDIRRAKLEMEIYAARMPSRIEMSLSTYNKLRDEIRSLGFVEDESLIKECDRLMGMEVVIKPENALSHRPFRLNITPPVKPT